MRRAAFVPVVAFLVLLGFLGYRLLLVQEGDTPNLIPSAMIDKPAPDFTLPPLLDGKPGLAAADLKGHVTFVNFFASWCVPCRVEHPLLSRLAPAGVVLVGIDYKDKPEDARKYLRVLGDPYGAVAADRDGQVAIDFGVYGVPESYLIDKTGRIRFKQVGPLTEADLSGKILPLVAELNR